MSLYNKLQRLLIDAALSETEVLIYIELLKSQAQTGLELVKRTGLSKSSVYRALDKLENINLIKRTKDFIQALSLKCFVAELSTEERKIGKLAYKLKQIAPFLSAPHDMIEKFEQFYTKDQIREAYLFMSEIDYTNNLDFGDFENFIKKVGGMETALKFRNNRVKHAGHHAICTTFGPYTSYFSTKDAAQQFKNKTDLLKCDFTNKFITFSDNQDYVLFNDIDDEENITSTLIKSKQIADAQRAQFSAFSQIVGK